MRSLEEAKVGDEGQRVFEVSELCEEIESVGELCNARARAEGYLIELVSSKSRLASYVQWRGTPKHCTPTTCTKDRRCA